MAEILASDFQKAAAEVVRGDPRYLELSRGKFIPKEWLAETMRSLDIVLSMLLGLEGKIPADVKELIRADLRKIDAITDYLKERADG
jgi:hypothetical protein